MKNRVLAAMLGWMLALAAQATTIGFTGAWAPGTWSTLIVGSVAGGGANDGSVNTSGAPNSITLIGGDDPSGTGCSVFMGCEIQFNHPSVGEAPISFHWSYTSTDSAGAQLDYFGVLLDGVHDLLSDPGGQATQQGDVSFSPLGTFGFYVNCGDCVGGNASVTISAFQVPEPASMALIGLALLGLGMRRRKASN